MAWPLWTVREVTAVDTGVVPMAQPERARMAAEAQATPRLEWIVDALIIL
jgi:hypothetical protein